MLISTSQNRNQRRSRHGSVAVLVFAAGAFLCSIPSSLIAEPVATMRLDYYHTGNANSEIFSVDRVVIEPLPWPGNPARAIDDTGLGKYLFEVKDAETQAVLYSRGFASIYGEWETTAEASKRHRTFHESLRFPVAATPIEVVIHKRAADQSFQPVWTTAIDPTDMFIDSSSVPPLELLEIAVVGDSAERVDLLLLGDGYTAAERGKFVADAKRFTKKLFSYSPFRERRADFNVWGLSPGATESGISRPSTGIHRRSPVGTTYDAFGSERYVLTFENRAFRDLAAWAPYEFVEILVNGETYGGGGIFGQFGTVAADNDWAGYVFVHEFGHHFAALADEYYTSSVAYELDPSRPEPWERNATALKDAKALKWRHLITEDVAIPTPWPKEPYEVLSAEIQSRRRAIRAANRPESEMSALFTEQSQRETKLLESHDLINAVGAFEGANYADRGYFRPQMDCVMFSRNDVAFCQVCQHAISEVIDLYTEGATTN